MPYVGIARAEPLTMVDRVSVIIPSRNRLPLLQRAIDSVNRQGHASTEILIFDNRSDIPIQLADLRSALPVKIVRSEAMECKPIALNRMLDACSGDFICYLDDDDEYTDRKFADALAAMRRLPHVAMVYGNTQHRSADGNSITARGPATLESFLRWRHIHINSVMIRRRVLDHVKFDERMKTFEDVKFIGQVIRDWPVEHIDEVHAIWYRDKRPDQLTNRNYRRSLSNWKLLCAEFSVEIHQHRALKTFYYKKLLLLSLMLLDVSTAVLSVKKLVTPVNPAPLAVT